MKKFSKLIGFVVVFISVMAVFCTMSFAATVGEPLTSAESEWQRIDDRDSNIVYLGDDWVKEDASDSYTGYYNWTLSYRTSHDEKIKFKFKGTKIRIIASINSNRSTNNIYIDGVKETYSEYSDTWKGQILVYEKVGLVDAIHTVVITNLDKGLVLDAIDIDTTGYLVNYYVPFIHTTSAGFSKINLSWDAIEGATSYIIKRATTSGGEYTTIAETVTETKYTDSTVTNGNTYYYVVSAIVDGNKSPNSNEVSVTPQVTSKLKLVLEVNEEKQLSISEELSDNTEMEWTSSDSTIATVDENGKVKALKSGNTVITCTSEDKSYTESINVLVVDLEYQLAVDLNVGDKCRLTVDDLSNTTNVTWSSYDSTIANVSAKGKVTATSEGLTYIVASNKDGNEIGRIYIRVRQ